MYVNNTSIEEKIKSNAVKKKKYIYVHTLNVGQYSPNQTSKMFIIFVSPLTTLQPLFLSILQVIVRMPVSQEM